MYTALIGVGYWGSILKRYIEASEFFGLASVCDSKSNLDDVWNNGDIGAVVVATPIETHYEIVKAALLAGKHVFSEKPLALKSSQCCALRQIALKNKLVLHTEYIYAFSRSLKRVQEMMETKRFGELLALEMNVKHLGRFGRHDVFWLLASHMLSVLDMFCPLEFLDFCFVDLVDGETGAIFFDGGVKGTINVSLNYPWKETKIVFYFEDATVEYNPKAFYSINMVRYKKPEWVIQRKIPQHLLHEHFDEGDNLRYAFESFQNCILGKEKSNVDLAVEITRIIEHRQ